MAIRRFPRHGSEHDALATGVVRLMGAQSVSFIEPLQSLWGGYGEICRMGLEGNSGEQILIAKRVTPPLGPADRSHRRKLRSYAVEHCWYARYAPRCRESCRVAKVLHLEATAGCWLFLLEDLDAAGYSLRPASPTPEQLERCLGWLAQFHATFLHEEPEGLWKLGTYWHLDTRPDELAALQHAELRRAAPVLDAGLRQARFRTLVHGDAKLENFCFSESDVAAVDFQYVGGGVGVQDVAYFLNSCCSAQLWPHVAPQALDTYMAELRRALRERSPAVDAASVEQEWRELYPVAWADFYRFLLGWAPGEPRDSYSEQMLRQASPALVSRQSRGE